MEKIRSLLVSEVTRWKDLLITRCRSCSSQKITCYSLQSSLVTRCKKITRYSLQKLLVAKYHSLLVAEVARCKKFRFRCKIHLLYVAKLACYSLQQIICYSMQKMIHHSLKQSQVHKVTWKIYFFNIICFVEPKISKLFQINIISWNLLLAKYFKTQQYTNR